jgi:DNA-binding transcriptional LysR family regulator
MEFDNVEAIRSVVAVGLGASIIPNLALGPGRATSANVHVLPLSPRASRQVALVRLRGKRGSEGMDIVAKALLELKRHR